MALPLASISWEERPSGSERRLAMQSKRLLGWAAMGLLGVACAVLLAVLVLTQIMGWHFVIVSGSSMEPTIGYGSVALMRPIDGEAAGPGDIVEFYSPQDGRVTTHRIVERTEDGAAFITRGDNSFANDQLPVSPARIKGEYVLNVPFAGHAIWWLRTPAGFLSLIIIPGVLIALLEGWSLVKGLAPARVSAVTGEAALPPQ